MIVLTSQFPPGSPASEAVSRRGSSCIHKRVWGRWASGGIVADLDSMR